MTRKSKALPAGASTASARAKPRYMRLEVFGYYVSLTPEHPSSIEYATVAMLSERAAGLGAVLRTPAVTVHPEVSDEHLLAIANALRDLARRRNPAMTLHFERRIEMLAVFLALAATMVTGIGGLALYIQHLFF